MVNKKTVAEMVYELDDSISRLESGKYPRHSASWCADRISWLWQFRYITEEEMNRFADRMICIFRMEER